MTTLYRVRVRWQGFSGGPGISTLYFVNAPHLSAVRALFDGLKPNLPGTVTLVFANQQDTIESTTGELNGTWTDTAAANVVGTGTGTYAAAAGYGINWSTSGLVNGRHIVGHTYLVPGAGTTTTGIPTTTELATITTACGTFLTAAGSDFVIWSRPTASRAGSFHPVTGASALPYYTVLRSRRD